MGGVSWGLESEGWIWRRRRRRRRRGIRRTEACVEARPTIHSGKLAP
jgi:hypothetical protein